MADPDIVNPQLKTIMTVFIGGCDIPCPKCPPYGKYKRRHLLDCVERNYTGSGSDVGQCPECGKAWFIEYTPKVSHRAKDWDGPSRARREADERDEALAIQAETEARDREDYRRLFAKFHGASPDTIPSL